MINLTRERVERNRLMFNARYEALEKMGTCLGTKAAALALWNEAMPEDSWMTLQLTLMLLQKGGYLEGVKIVGGTVMEPVRPRITEKGYDNWEEMGKPEHTDEVMEIVERYKKKHKTAKKQEE